MKDAGQRGVSRVFVQDDFRLRVVGLSSLPLSAVRLGGQFCVELDRSGGRRGTRGVNTDFLIIFGSYIPQRFPFIGHCHAVQNS